MHTGLAELRCCTPSLCQVLLWQCCATGKLVPGLTAQLKVKIALISQQT